MSIERAKQDEIQCLENTHIFGVHGLKELRQVPSYATDQPTEVSATIRM